MTRSEPPSAYDQDFFLWTQNQASALRRTAIAGELDAVHLAEEIEDLGKRDLREVTSNLRRLLEQLIKIDAFPQSNEVPHWRGEVLLFASSAVDAYTPGMRQLIEVDAIWRRAAKLAEAQLREAGIAYAAPTSCPCALDDLLTDGADLDALLAALARSRSSAAES